MKTCALPLLVVFQLAFLAGSAHAEDAQIIDLSASSDTSGNVILNTDDANNDFNFNGGVGSGPDLSGNGSMVQIVQPITTTGTNGTTSNGQITYRYVPASGGR